MLKNLQDSKRASAAPTYRSRPTHHQVFAGGFAVSVLIAAVLLANWVTTDFGFIPMGFGLEATAGTIFAGFALAARDAIQDTFGRITVLGVIGVGTALSFLIAAPAIAIASAAAFGIAELLNFAVYTPLRARSKLGDKRWAVAVVSSNIVGAVTDTIVFLGIAFGLASIMPALPGQLVGKMYATVLYLLIGATVGYLIKRRKAARENSDAASTG